MPKGRCIMMDQQVFLYCFCYLFLLFHGYNAERVIDMESYDCVQVEPFKISDNDLVRIKAQPRHDIGDRYQCKIVLEAEQERYFKVYIADIDIKECGVSLIFYNNKISSHNIVKEFDCHSSPGSYFSTRSNILIVEVSKLTSSNNIYWFSIITTTNNGPHIDRSNSIPSFNRHSTLKIFFLILAAYINIL